MITLDVFKRKENHLTSIDNTSFSLIFFCVYSQIKDGKINGEGIKNLPAPKPFTDEIINQCQSIGNPDRCELAVQFTECVMNGIAKNAPRAG